MSKLRDPATLPQLASWEDAIAFHRAALFGYAYRMLSSASEAEDVLQDVWLRLRDRDLLAIENPRAYLMTTVSRLCLDRLRRASRKRETYVGPWLPEPVLTSAFDVDTPLQRSQSISFAFLRLLEELSATERAAFLLHHVLEMPSAAVAASLETSETAVRKAASRARKKVDAGKPRFAASVEKHAELLGAFGAAVTQGNTSALEALLAEDVKVVSDGGGKVSASTKEIVGRDRAALFLLGIFRLADGDGLRVQWASLNGWPAALVFEEEALTSAIQIETDGERAFGIYIVRNPDKLAHLRRELGGGPKDRPGPETESGAAT